MSRRLNDLTYVISEIRISDSGYPYIEQQGITDNKQDALALFNSWCEDFGARLTQNMRYGKQMHMKAIGIDNINKKFTIDLSSF